MNERIFIFTQNEKNCISPNVDVNPYFPELSHPLESLSIGLFNQKLPSKIHKNNLKMKINLICLVAAAAGQTTTWETTTTEYTTKVDDWCGRHHDTLESFTRQVSLKKYGDCLRTPVPSRGSKTTIDFMPNLYGVPMYFHLGHSRNRFCPELRSKSQWKIQ